MINDTVIIDTESDLINSFRPRDRKHLEIPDALKFPLKFDHYLTWTESTGRYQFLAFRKYGQQELVGMVFDRSDTGQPGRMQMCSWCHTSGSSSEIDMVGIEINNKVNVGVVLCLDFSCLSKLENIAKVSKKSVDRLARDVVARMSHFFEEKFEVGH